MFNRPRHDVRISSVELAHDSMEDGISVQLRGILVVGPSYSSNITVVRLVHTDLCDVTTERHTRSHQFRPDRWIGLDAVNSQLGMWLMVTNISSRMPRHLNVGALKNRTSVNMKYQSS